MKSWPTRIALLAGCSAALAFALPAFSQEAPEQLPPGFGDPGTPAPPPPPTPTDIPQVTENAINPARPAPPRRSTSLPQEEGALIDEELLPPPLPADLFIVPEGVRQQTASVGPLRGRWSLGSGAFGRAHGGFLAGVMRRTDAPIPSRWMQILLRRALLTNAPAPPAIDPVDWVAERAWLLLRMGEADAARMLVQSVDVPNYTPRMVLVAREAALASADVAGLCPLVSRGRQINDEPVWTLSEAMCAALEGEAARAGILIDGARRRGPAGGVDLSLAEKVVGAGTDSRRAVTLEWDRVEGLNPWRLGLANATGTQIPQNLLGGAPSYLRAWAARAPMLPVEQRLDLANTAAALGVFSTHDLAEMYAIVLDQGSEGQDGPGATALQLRNAWVHRDRGRRLAALRDLWDVDAAQVYGRYILTAGAAARVEPSAERLDDADELIASMFSAGMDGQAAEWLPVITAGDRSDRAWALLAVGLSQPGVEVTSDRIEDFASAGTGDAQHRGALLVAALAGLERLGGEDANALAETYNAGLGREDVWTRMLDNAVRARQPGTVAVLAAAGMQTGSWAGVHPGYLFRTLRALRALGLDYEARMIAAEAITRA